jgi:hypothetical protein
MDALVNGRGIRITWHDQAARDEHGQIADLAQSPFCATALSVTGETLALKDHPSRAGQVNSRRDGGSERRD